MRSDLVVLTLELFDRDLRMDSVSEPLDTESLIAELAVERFIFLSDGSPKVRSTESGGLT